ncbi:PDZ domain-containing protein, partial [Arthrospira platensis SPKY1]|nr:PDZ domain-containing protein [Arthrospira platensis SPKY1]
AILSNEGKNFISTKFPTVVDSILPNSKASEAGLQKGDQIVGINEINTDNFLSFSAEIAKIKNDSLTLKVLRNQQEVLISAKTNEEGKLGFVNKMPDLTPYLTYEKY